MYEGLWTVEFITADNQYGKGVIVLNQNRILGGDSGYYYTGTCDINGNSINGSANIIRYDQNLVSVFGNIGHFVLNFNGNINERQMSLNGFISNNQHASIRITGIKKEDL